MDVVVKSGEMIGICGMRSRGRQKKFYYKL